MTPILALATTLLLFAARIPGDGDIKAAISASDAPLGTHGTSKTLNYRVRASGTLHVWAASQAFDPWLRVEFGASRGSSDDDNSGGGTTAWLASPVEAGDEVRIHVATNAADGAGEFVVSVRELPETEATLAAAKEARAAVDDAVQLRNYQQKHEEARARLRAGLEKVTSTPGASDSAAAITSVLRVLQDAYHLNDYETTLAAARFRHDAIERLWPPDSKPVQEARFQYGEILGEGSDKPRGRAMCEQALAVYRRTLGANDVDLYTAVLGVAQAYYLDSDFDESEALMREAIAGLERLLPDDGKLLNSARIGYANTLSELGLLDEARELQETAIKAMPRYFAPDDPFFTGAQINLSATLSALGDHQGALAMCEHLVAFLTPIVPPDDPDLLSARMNLAVQYMTLGQCERAKDLLEEVVARQASLASMAPVDRILGRTNLAVAYNDLGEHEHALALLQPMLDDPTLKLEQDADRMWRVLLESAVACNSVGRSAESIANADRALEILATHSGPDDPDLFDAQYVVAKLALRAKDRARAAQLARSAALGSKAFFARCATTLATREAGAVHRNWSRLVSDGLCILASANDASDRDAANALALELVESSRSIDGAALRLSRELAAGSARAEVDQHRNALLRLTRQIAHSAGRDDLQADLHKYVAAKQDEERALKLVLARNGPSGSKMLDVDARKIAAALPSDHAAIGYWAYEARADVLTQHVAQPRELLAFVVRRGRAPVRVELGPISDVQRACEAWRGALLGDDAAAAKSAGEKLAKLVVDPLRAALEGAVVWHVALDDELHLVPLDALPVGDVCLGDKARVIATPTLVELSGSPLETNPDPALLALGGIDYDHEPDETAPRDHLVARLEGATDGLRTGARGDLAPLWETSSEIADVSKLFKSAAKSKDGAKVDLLEERYATKSALFELAPKARFLHIATHGFFAPESVPALGERASDPRFDPLSQPETALSAAGFAPLALCGLALSGANLPPSNPRSDEAIATAEELAALDLSHCELVVLSACDTNVGFLRAGQGIASFQTALHAAGARSVITSLWKVRDDATRELMSAFYKAMWIDGVTSKAEALWRAKSELRSRRAPARDWAGWVLSGAE